LVYFHPIRWLQRFRELRKTAAASHNEVKTLFLLPNYLNLFAVIVSALPFELMDRHAVCRGVFTTIYIFSQTKSGLSKRISNSLDFMNESSVNKYVYLSMGNLRLLNLLSVVNGDVGVGLEKLQSGWE